MAKQMLNVSDGSTSTQQPSGESLSQIVRGNVSNTSAPECSFQCSIVLNRARSELKGLEVGKGPSMHDA
jgi:hypothetical protein